MSTTITKIIEQYLENELSPEDKAAFEKRLKENVTLRTELERLQQIRQAAGRAAVRTVVVRVGKRYHLLRNATFTAIAVGIILIAAILVWLVSGKHDGAAEQLDDQELASLYEQLSTKAPLEHIPVTYFYLQTADTVVLSETGVLLSVPETAFLLNGQPYSGAKIVQWQEAIDAAAIVKAGLSTVSGNRLLETQGMFGMQAFTPEGKQLEVNPKVGVYVQVPVDELKEGMQLFEGKRMKNGQIDWQNPQPLEKLPVMASMNELDFYPPGYEAKLDELKWKTGKKDRDSLYLSMEEESILPNVVAETASPKDIQLGKQLFESRCATCHQAHTDGTGPALFGVRQKWADGGAQPNSIYEWVVDWNSAAKNDPYARKVSYKRPTQMSTFHDLEGKKDQIDAIFDYVDSRPFPNAKMPEGFIFGASFQIELPEDMAQWKFRLERNGNEATVIAEVDIRKNWHINSIDLPPGTFGYPTKFRLQPSPYYRLSGKVEEPTPIRKHDNEADEDLSYHEGKVVFKQKITVLTSAEIAVKGSFAFQPCDATHCLAPYEGTFTVGMNGSDSISNSSAGIPPSKVLAFWQPKFDKTILATRDFEKRMRAVHGTCSEAVLDLYTDNLNKPLYEIDAQVAGMGYAEFAGFATERVGGVQLDNPHMNNLRQFYAHATAQLRKQAKKDRNLIRKLESGWDRSLEKARRKQQVNSNRRQRVYVQQETTFNYPAMARQLGSRNTIGFTIRNGGPRSSNVHNVDRYARSERTNQPITIIPQPTVKYSDFTASIVNAAAYERVFLYLFPHELNSYQRFDAVNGQFSTRLNDAIRYDALLVGMNESGFAIAEKHAVSGGDLELIALQQVNEQEFNRRLELMNSNRGTKPASVTLELDWLQKEQANYKVQRLRMERQAFRNTIRSVVFPCGMPGGTEWEPVEDSEIQPEEQIQLR